MTAEDTSPQNIKTNLTGLRDSANNPAPVAHLPGQPSSTSTPKNQLTIKKDFFLPSTLGGGTIPEIANSITKEILGENSDNKANEVLNKFFNRTARGFSAGLSMMCKGTRCPFIKYCPLQQANVALPIGQLCPVEDGLIQMWVNKHLIALSIIDPYDPENSFDMDIIYEIAAHELLKYRASLHLSEKGQLIEEKQVGGTPTGDQIFQDVLNPILELLQYHSRVSTKLRESLVATREAQINAGKQLADPNERSSAVVNKARNLLKERLNKNIKDAEFEIK
jgi:hypothetical protein